MESHVSLTVELESSKSMMRDWNLQEQGGFICSFWSVIGPVDDNPKLVRMVQS